MYHPQGVAYIPERNALIICDTKNHKLRLADLESRRIETLAGTGARGQDRLGGSSLLEQEIASPWDITYWKDNKYLIAMAGSH